MNRVFKFIGIFGAWLLLAIFTVPAAATTRVVEEVEVRPVAEGTEILINFNFPLRYISHVPANKGKLMQVELKPLSVTPDLIELLGRKVFSWQPSAEKPLRTLTYEGGSPGGPQLLLEFDREVEYRIKGGGDPLRLTILLLPKLEKPRPEVAAPPVAPLVPVVPVVTKAQTQPALPQPTPQLVEVSVVDISLPYAINLESSLTQITSQLPLGRQDLEHYRLYLTRFKKGSQNWNRLRLGFFPDKKSAQQVMLSLKKDFPNAWLTRTSATERRNSAKTAVYEPAALIVEIPAEPDPSVSVTVVPAPVVAAPVEKKRPPLPPERRKSLLDQAEASMIAGDYQRAALLYTGLLQAEDAATRQLAQEYLGLARDRANQLAHAKAEYEKYLQLYPEGEGAERVQQRLTALLTARSAPKAPLRKGKQQPQGVAWRHEAYGSFSQFYFHDSLTIDNEETLLAQSSLRSDIDINTRSRSENLDFRTTFIGGLENDFRDQGEDDFRISSLYMDLAARDPELSFRLGRQSRSSGGVLGRFDGGLLRWQLSERIAANLVGGFPVFSTRETSIDTDRPLYGISFDFGTFASRWDLNLFVINQEVYGLTDRRAVGGEVRYFEPTRSFFTLVDYDILYDKLNTALFNGNLRLPDNTTLTFSADYRNSPVLTTSNALQGQTAETVADLLKQFTEEEIRQLALDRTATSQTYTLGATRPINSKLQISGDFAVSRFGATPASGGVEAMDGTGDMFFTSLQLTGSSLIKEGDIAIIGLRYSNTNTADTWALNLNTRYPLTRQLRLNPKMLFDYRENTSNSGNRWRIRPALRMEYRWKRRLYLEFEGGAEWANETIAGQLIRNRDYFFSLGYRFDF